MGGKAEAAARGGAQPPAKAQQQQAEQQQAEREAELEREQQEGAQQQRDPRAVEAAVGHLPEAVRAFAACLATASGDQPPDALEAAWEAYLFPGRPEVWQFAKTLLPEITLWSIHHLDPSACYPDH